MERISIHTWLYCRDSYVYIISYIHMQGMVLLVAHIARVGALYNSRENMGMELKEGLNDVSGLNELLSEWADWSQVITMIVVCGWFERWKWSQKK